MTCGFALISCASASAAEPPSIEGESVSQVTSTDATLEASLDPGDAAHGVYYQFQVADDLGEYVTEIVCPPEPSSGPARPCTGGTGAHSVDALPISLLPSGPGPEGVALDLASAGMALTPGATYQYRVLVATAIESEDTIEWESPSTVGEVHSFTTPGPGPSVEAESASKVTSTDATLEARLNPGDAPHGAYYQFQLVEDPNRYENEIVCPLEAASGPFRPCIGSHSPAALPIGFVPAAAGPTPVSLDLGSAGVTLRPGTAYHFRVLVAAATLSEDTIEWESPAVPGADQTFTTASAPAQPGDPIADPPSLESAQPATLAPLFRHHRHRRHHHHRRHRRPRRLGRHHQRP